jgi:hypothetical protein
MSPLILGGGDCFFYWPNSKKWKKFSLGKYRGADTNVSPGATANLARRLQMAFRKGGRSPDEISGGVSSSSHLLGCSSARVSVHRRLETDDSDEEQCKKMPACGAAGCASQAMLARRAASSIFPVFSAI